MSTDQKPATYVIAAFLTERSKTVLTEGKLYRVFDDDGETFGITSDRGFPTLCKWIGDPNLDMIDWVKVEIAPIQVEVTRIADTLERIERKLP